MQLLIWIHGLKDITCCKLSNLNFFRFKSEVISSEENPLKIDQNIVKEALLPNYELPNDIEFLTNSNSIIDYFVVGETLMIIDSHGYLNAVFSIKYSQHQRLKL